MLTRNVLLVCLRSRSFAELAKRWCERLALGDLASRGGWGFLFRSCVRGLRVPLLPRLAAHGEAPAPQATEAATALQWPAAIPGNRR